MQSKIAHRLGLVTGVVLSVLFGLLLSLPAWAQAGTGQNLNVTLLPSAARTVASVTVPDQTNAQWKGIIVITDVTAFTSGTYTVTIQGKDPVSGKYYTILSGAALAGTGTQVLKVYPGITAAANLSASDVLPRTWRVSIAGAATPSMTFSVGAVLIY